MKLNTGKQQGKSGTAKIPSKPVQNCSSAINGAAEQKGKYGKSNSIPNNKKTFNGKQG